MTGKEKEEADFSEAKEWISTLLVVVTLIATMSFAAPFAMPGGVSSDNGVPVRMHSAALKAFIIADTLALSFSMSVIILCFHVQRTLFRYKQPGKFPRFASKKAEQLFGVESTITWSNMLAQCAFVSTMVSYAFGLYVLIAPTCLWLAIIIIVAASAVCLVGVVWQVALFIKLIEETSNESAGPLDHHEKEVVSVGHFFKKLEYNTSHVEIETSNESAGPLDHHKKEVLSVGHFFKDLE